MLSPAISTIEDHQGPSRRTHKSLSCRSAPEIHAPKRVFPQSRANIHFLRRDQAKSGFRVCVLETWTFSRRIKRDHTIELRLRTRRVDRGIEAEVVESAEGMVESQAE